MYAVVSIVRLTPKNTRKCRPAIKTWIKRPMRIMEVWTEIGEEGSKVNESMFINLGRDFGVLFLGGG